MRNIIEIPLDEFKKNITKNPKKLERVFEILFLEYMQNPREYYKILTRYRILEKHLEKNENIQILNRINLSNDNSITKYVSDKFWFKKIDYIPKNLKQIIKYLWDNNCLLDSKEDSLLRENAINNLNNLAIKFHQKFSEKLTILSSYRDYTYQKKVFEDIVVKRWSEEEAKKWCALPWFSEHQSGLALDIARIDYNTELLINEFEKNEDYQNNEDKYKYLLEAIKRYEHWRWLNNNAYKYWFIQSYKKWLSIDWYNIEPWHYRYVWKKLSKFLQINNLSFWEYVNSSQILRDSILSSNQIKINNLRSWKSKNIFIQLHENEDLAYEETKKFITKKWWILFSLNQNKERFLRLYIRDENHNKIYLRVDPNRIFDDYNLEKTIVERNSHMDKKYLKIALEKWLYIRNLILTKLKLDENSYYINVHTNKLLNISNYNWIADLINISEKFPTNSFIIVPNEEFFNKLKKAKINCLYFKNENDWSLRDYLQKKWLNSFTIESWFDDEKTFKKLLNSIQKIIKSKKI